MINENNQIKDFTDLHVWQEGHKLVISMYKITSTFPKEETYSLVDQMRRAATSITCNIEPMQIRFISYYKDLFKKQKPLSNMKLNAIHHSYLFTLISK